MNPFRKLSLLKALLPLLLFLLTSCFELKETLWLNYDGSGSYQFIFDFSESSDLIKKVLSIEADRSEPSPATGLVESLAQSFTKGAEDFKNIPGILSSSAISNTDSLQFGYSLQFSSVRSLNQALALNNFDSATNVYVAPYYSYKKGRLERSPAFYLTRLFRGIDSLFFSKMMGLDSLAGRQLMHKPNYHFTFYGSGKSKRMKSALPDSLVLMGDKQVGFYVPLWKISNPETDLSFEIRFKKK